MHISPRSAMACHARFSCAQTLPSSSLRCNPANQPGLRSGGVANLGLIRSRNTVRWGVRAAVSETMGSNETSWVEFPKLSSAGKQLMESVAVMMDRELGALIKDSKTPADVRSFQGGTGEGSVTLRAGRLGSKIDLVLGSWLNCSLSFGALNIATLIAMMGLTSDAPHLLFEFIQSGPDNLVLVLDLVPRTDLVVDPEYLARFYENSGLEDIRQTFEKHPQTQPHRPSALYLRSIVSPTALLYEISGEGVEGGLDAVISDLVQPAAVKVVQTWVKSFKYLGRAMDSDTMAYMKTRDDLIKRKGVEVDLSANMPRLFGQEIADRVVTAFRKGV
ncbi:hypothetical protein M758_7G046300 [Ceratodon purpureus]|nr:hypothetical protein M758_7G046300 [Ceratodon purpureus]